MFPDLPSEAGLRLHKTGKSKCRCHQAVARLACRRDLLAIPLGGFLGRQTAFYPTFSTSY
jgi:hypothetical protein